MKSPIPLASGVLLIALAYSPSPAAALKTGAGAVPREALSASDVHAAANRHCARRNGVRHCRQAAAAPAPSSEFDREGYGYTYGAPRAEFYPAGTMHWWRAMEREGRTANPPN